MASAPPPPPKPAAGWYPDPEGGAQRNFDGTNWGPTASTRPPLKHRTLSGKQIIGVIAGIVFLLFLIGRCGSDGNTKSEDSSSRNSTSTSTSSRSPSATATPTPTGPTKPSATFTTAPGPD